MMTPGDIDKLQKECDFEYMKENSIEEDIKKAEELIKKCDKCKLTECINCEISWTEIASIRRIIDNYRNILKENEEWQKTYQEEKDKQFEIIRKNQELEKRWDNDTHKLQNDLDIANAKIVELQKELNQENKKCMMLAIEKQDYFEKYRYHLQQNESLTKEFSNVIPVQKVKNKIEEIGEKIKYEENEKVVIYLHKQKNILQELLESEE